MPVIITALIAIGVHAASVVARKIRRSAGTPTIVADHPPVGARRPRSARRREAA
jgi:hypothetical protein